MMDPRIQASVDYRHITLPLPTTGQMDRFDQRMITDAREDEDFRAINPQGLGIFEAHFNILDDMDQPAQSLHARINALWSLFSQWLGNTTTSEGAYTYGHRLGYVIVQSMQDRTEQSIRAGATSIATPEDIASLIRTMEGVRLTNYGKNLRQVHIGGIQRLRFHAAQQSGFFGQHPDPRLEVSMERKCKLVEEMLTAIRVEVQRVSLLEDD